MPRRPHIGSWPAPVLTLGVTLMLALGAGCATQSGDGQILPQAAAGSPPAASPAGTVVALGAAAVSVAVDPVTRTAAVAEHDPDRLVLFDVDHPAAPARTVPLPGPAGTVRLAAPGGPLLVATTIADQVLSVPLPTGAPVTAIAVPGHPVDATASGVRLLVALAGGGVAVVEDGRVARTVGDQPGIAVVIGAGGAAVVVSVGSTTAVLDRQRSALTLLDPATGALGPGLRVGDGASNAVADNLGRILITDTRDGELLLVGIEPFLLRQRFPVAGSPYGVAFDQRRGLAWVTLTATNELVGFDVAGGEPVPRFRFPTVRQPNAVAVDPTSGRVLVASATGEGLQVVQP